MKELTIILSLALAAILLGLLVDELAWCLFGATLIWIWLQAGEFRKVRAWSRRPLRRPDNGMDSWFDISYAPYRALLRERQRTRDMALRLRELLGLADVIPDGVIQLRPNGDIESLNTAAKKLLHLSDKDIGLGLATVVRSPDFVRFLSGYGDSKSDEPLDFTAAANPEQDLEARLFDAGGGWTVVMLRDITALNRLLTMRQNFVANVSHELRTPLTVMSGYLETMSDESEPEELRLSLVERLTPPLKRMQTLVDDLMLLTQLESTPIAAQQDPIYLPDVVNTAVQELQGLCESPEQIRIHFDSQQTILGIETELHSLCVNLLSNALNYSPSGAPVDISVTDHGDAVRLTIKDNGYGIAPEHLDRITERFYSVDSADARTRGGTGLGLAIVKHVLLRHDSSLQVTSTLGSGSTFYCDFEPIQQ